MIPTDEVILKLHAAKSKAAFLSDFLGEPISITTGSNQHLVSYSLRGTNAIHTRYRAQDLIEKRGARSLHPEMVGNICEMRREELEPEVQFALFDDDTTPETPVRSETAKQERDSIAHNLLHRGFAGTTFF